jgi:alkylhydroperoxidase family enzyme
MIEYPNAAPGVKAIYDEGMAVMGLTAVPNWMKVMGNNEFVLKANWEKFRHVVLEGTVPQLLKQLILFSISIKVGNRYCTAAHGHAALGLDKTLSYEDLISLAEGKAYPTLPKSFQVAIEMVTQAALHPKNVAKEDFDFEERLRDEGFSEQEIDELMAQADFGVMMNMITDIWEIPPDQEFPPKDRTASGSAC